MTGPRVLVVVRDGCHLCDEAVAIAARVCTEMNVAWASANVDADPALAEHTDHVPVTFVDGRRLAIWFLDERQLRAALAS